MKIPFLFLSKRPTGPRSTRRRCNWRPPMRSAKWPSSHISSKELKKRTSPRTAQERRDNMLMVPRPFPLFLQPAAHAAGLHESPKGGRSVTPQRTGAETARIPRSPAHSTGKSRPAMLASGTPQNNRTIRVQSINARARFFNKKIRGNANIAPGLFPPSFPVIHSRSNKLSDRFT